MPDSVPGKLVAPEPVPPVRAYSFTDWQVSNPTAPPPGDRLDAEFDRGNATQSQTIDWVGTSLNTDGTLRSGIVGEPQLVPGLFDFIADDAVDMVQPLVDQAGSYATAALGSANTASSHAVSASASSTTAIQAATNAQTAVTTAQGAATSALSSANLAGASAASAMNSANHADGSEAVAQAYADVGMAWAEYMPWTIPPNILAVQGVTGDHWSARWWANQAAELVSGLESSIAAGPPRAIVYYYTYIATAGQTVFTGADRDGKLLTYHPGPQETVRVYANGLLRTSTDDYVGTANTVTFTKPRAAGDVIQVLVEGIATDNGYYLALTGGTMTGPITLAADPAGPMQPVTRQYADGKYLTFAGGTLTGPLTLAADPVAAMQPATRQYVDGTVASAAYLPLIGGNLTGPLVLAADPTAAKGAATKQYVDGKVATAPYLPVAGGTLTGPVTLAADPVASMQPATRQYVDNHAPLGGPYLPLSGGTLSGALQVGDAPNGYAVVGGSDATHPGFIAFYTGDGLQRGFVGSNDGGTRLVLASANGYTGWTVTGGLSVVGSLGTASAFVAASISTVGALVAGSISTSGTFSAGSISTAGAISAGSISTAGTLTAGALNTSGNASITGTVSAGAVTAGNVSSTGNASVAARLTVNDMMNNSGAFFVGGSTAYYLARSNVDANWRFVESGNTKLTIAPDGNVSVRAGVFGTYIQSSGAMTAGTSQQIMGVGTNWSYWGNPSYIGFSWNTTNLDVYVDYTYIGSAPSDERLKTVIGPYGRGLAELRQIDPVLYHLRGNDRGVAPDAATQRELNAGPSIRDTSKVHAGFIAQRVEAIFPELVKRRAAVIDGEKLDDVRFVDDGPWLTFALINAIKELDARLTALEPGWHESEHPRDDAGRFT